MKNDKSSEIPDGSDGSSAVQFREVEPDEAGRRLDNYLLNVARGVPKSRVYRAIRSGEVRVNKGRKTAAYRLLAGDRVRVPPFKVTQRSAPVASEKGQSALLDCIIEKHKAYYVINKPAGMAVHGGSGISLGVIETLRQALPAEHYLELVHRLDRDTSGCLVVARKRPFLRELHRQIRDDAVDKRYLLLVKGSWDYGRIQCKLPLQTHQRSNGERHVVVADDGKYCHTEFRAVEYYPGASLIEARLHTGRTHQIRVHAAHLGHPIAGDLKYGEEKTNRTMRKAGLKRMFLHASSVAFEYPEGNPVQYDAPLGKTLTTVLNNLENQRTRGSRKS